LLRTKPIVRWPGGKSRHLKYILPLIPEHHCYCEPFAGGLAVFLARGPSKLEVINDQNGTLVALYRNAQYHVEELVAEIQWTLNARKNLEDFKEEKGLTEIQRVARWFVRNRISYGAKGLCFGYEGARASRQYAIDSLRELSQRLDRTIIEQLPYEDCVRHYDKRDTFFFLDPPYLNANPGAYAGWTADQMQGLRDLLSEIKGKWILTVDDSPGTRSIFADFKLKGISFDNKLVPSHLGRHTMRELIITPAESRPRRRVSSAASRRHSTRSGGTLAIASTT
jgi:DNA adenine methylase